MTQVDIDTLATSIPSINLSAIKEVDKKTMDITEVMTSANSAFKIGELPPTHCGDIDYKLVPIGDQPFLTLDKELKKLLLQPKLAHLAGDYKASL